MFYCADLFFFFFFKQKTAYEMRISDWSSDVCSSDLSTWDSGTPQCSAAKSTSRPWMVLQAASAAMPLMSEPEEAAVAEVFGTLPVEVAVMRTRSMSTWKAWATTCATLV